MGSTHCVEYPRNARFCRITGKSLPIVHNVAEAFLSALLDRLTLPCTVEGDQPVLVALLESRGTPNRSVNSKDECTFYETPFPRLAYIEAVERRESVIWSSEDMGKVNVPVETDVFYDGDRTSRKFGAMSGVDEILKVLDTSGGDSRLVFILDRRISNCQHTSR
jgi:hypothetical protein